MAPYQEANTTRFLWVVRQRWLVTLNAQLTNGFNPPVSSTYSVLEADSVSGTFSTVNGQVAAFKSFIPQYDSTELKLRVGIQAASFIPATDATSLTVPSIPGDGVELELFNGIGGGQTPFPSISKASPPPARLSALASTSPTWADH